VYPTIAIDGISLSSRRLRWVTRTSYIALMSRRSIDIRSRMLRRSVTILV
jgi:hypothetical protein